jgi:ACS family tartrate transporter-like MFS transporter
MPTQSELEDPVGRSALRKASLRLIPLISLGYGAAYMDRINISFASLQMNRDLHFSATVYGFGAGLFFLAYAACEIPSNLLLYRIGARRWLSRIMVTWGLVAMAMLLVRTPSQFYAMRFLLGVAEAGFFPGILFYLTQWFPASYRARTMSRWYIALPLSSVFMGAIAGSLLDLNGRFGLSGWQWLFLIEGLPAILLGVIFFMVLPDSPHDAKWLTPGERDWIINSIEAESANTTHSSHSVLSALRDPRVWQIGIFMMLMLASNYAITFSAPAILQASTHLSNTYVGFLISGMNILAVGSMLVGALSSDRTGERFWHVIVPCVVAACAFVVCGVSNLPTLIVPGVAIIFVAYTFMQGPLWAVPPTFFTGRAAAAGIAAINMVGMLGGFLGPYTLGITKDLTGTYQRGLLLFAIPWMVAAGIMLYLQGGTWTSPRSDASPARTL